MAQGRLAGKVAIVTGGARGLGRAISQRLATEGASVVLVALHEETVREATQEIERTGARALGIAADVASEADTERYVEEAMRAFGRLDILVNNAGTITVGPIVETTMADWERVISVNLTGTYLGCREAARRMIAQGDGGRIINCSSGAGRRGNGLIAPYAASKFGIIGLTQSLAVELAPHRITVNAFCPGHVTSTPMWDFLDRELGRITGAEPGATKAAVALEVPLKRVGEPEEIAALVAFLASGEAGFITGESVLIDGGLIRF